MRKIISLAIILVLTLLVTACGGSGAPRQPQAQPAQPSKSTQPAQPAQPTQPAKSSGAVALTLKSPRMGACAIAADGKIFVLGGLDRSGNDLGEFLEVDPASGKVTGRASIPTPRNSAQAVAVGDSILLIGGRNASGMVASVEMYDVAKDAWQKLGVMPVPVWMHTAAAVGSKVYVIGGITSTGASRTSTNQVQVFDTANKSWSTGTPLPAPRQGAAVAVAGTRVLVFGGRLGGAATSGQATDTSLALDTVTGKWSELKKMPAARTSAVAVSTGNRAYVLGGAAGGSVVGSAVVYDFTSGSWSSGTSARTPRSGHCAAAVGNKLYLIGGASGSSVDTMLSSIEVIEIK